MALLLSLGLLGLFLGKDGHWPGPASHGTLGDGPRCCALLYPARPEGAREGFPRAGEAC